MKLLLACLVTAAVVAGGPQAVAQHRPWGRTAAEQHNLDFIMNFWNNVWTKRDASRVREFYAPNYIEHNTRVTGGVDGIVKYAKESKAREHREGLSGPTRSSQFIMATVDGDIVTLIFPRRIVDPCDPNKMITHVGFEMFRVRNDKIVEHWDEAIPVPKPAPASAAAQVAYRR